MNTTALLNHLGKALAGVSAIYLFGSHAQGTAGPDSDLDLAVLTDTPLDPVKLWQLAGELADISGCPVDLVDLRAASTVMQYQIITTGQRLWARDAQAVIYESFILGEKTNLDSARAGLLNDIAKEGRIHGR